MMAGQRVDKEDAWKVWILEQADTEEFFKVMNLASQGIFYSGLDEWKGEQEGDNSLKKDKNESHRQERRATVGRGN